MYFYSILFLLCLKVPFTHNSIFIQSSFGMNVFTCGIPTCSRPFTFQIQRFLSFPEAETEKCRLDLPLHLLLSVTLLLYIPVWFTSLNHPVSKPHPCCLISCFVATPPTSAHPPTASPSPLHPYPIYLYISFRAPTGAESMKNLSRDWTVSG